MRACISALILVDGLPRARTLNWEVGSGYVSCIVSERESAHAKLEARITLRYVLCRPVTYIEKAINFRTDLISDAYFNVTEGLESV